MKEDLIFCGGGHEEKIFQGYTIFRLYRDLCPLKKPLAYHENAKLKPLSDIFSLARALCLPGDHRSFSHWPRDPGSFKRPFCLYFLSTLSTYAEMPCEVLFSS